jgi:hypothetical protein
VDYKSKALVTFAIIFLAGASFPLDVLPVPVNSSAGNGILGVLNISTKQF